MHRGSTLLEFVAALTIFGLLLVGMQSSVAVAIKSIPNASSPVIIQCQAQRAIESLNADLQSALAIVEFTPASIAFTVPDRTGDGRSERIRYAWSGPSGAPLTRQINGRPAATIIPRLQSFSLTPRVEDETIHYPTLCVEDATESLLIDRSSVTQMLEHDVSSSLSLGQRFALDLPTNSYAWRPTRIQFQAKYAALLGMGTVQLRTSSLSYVPGTDALQQQFISWLTLGNNYAWHSFSFADVEPLPSGGSFSLVLQRYFGSRAATLLSSDTGNGLLKGNSAGTVWELQDGRGLVCQVFGKQWRAAGSRALIVRKYSSFEMDVRTTSSLPALNSTVALLNKPSVLTNDWNLDFASDPTLVDSNGDGQSDWSLSRSGAFNTAALTPTGWQTGGDQLVSNQDWNFSTPTIVEFTAQCDSVASESAAVALNVMRSGSICVPLTALVKKMPDGTQSVRLQVRTSDAQTETLLNLTQQYNTPLNIKLIIDPAISAISVFVGDVAHGTFGLTPYASSQSSRRLTLGVSGGSALFKNFRVRCL